MAVLLAAGAVAAGARRIESKPHCGLPELAAFLCARAEWRQAVFLVHAEDPGREGALVAEVAMRDTARPGHTVMRAWKWRPAAATAEELLLEMERAGVRVLVLDGAPGRRRGRNYRPFEDLARARPDRLRLIWNSGRYIRAYELLDARLESL
jgi:hypothetical protein